MENQGINTADNSDPINDNDLPAAEEIVDDSFPTAHNGTTASNHSNDINSMEDRPTQRRRVDWIPQLQGEAVVDVPESRITEAGPVVAMPLQGQHGRSELPDAVVNFGNDHLFEHLDLWDRPDGDDDDDDDDIGEFQQRLRQRVQAQLLHRSDVDHEQMGDGAIRDEIQHSLVRNEHTNIAVPAAPRQPEPANQPPDAAASVLVANPNIDPHQEHEQQQIGIPFPVPMNMVGDQGEDILPEEENVEISSHLFDLTREGRLCSCTRQAWSDGGCNVVVRQCQENPMQAQYSSPHLRSPLHEACWRNACRHIVRALLSAFPEAASEKDVAGNTPLHLAFVDFSSHHSGYQDIEEVVDQLLTAHSDVHPNFDMNTPLHMACMTSEGVVHPGVISKLVKSLDSCASLINYKNQTPLVLHCKRPSASVHIAEILLRAAPNTLEVLDSDGWAPIHYAAANANVPLLQYLTNTYQDEARILTSNQETALHILCRLHSKLSPVVAAPQRIDSGLAGGRPERSTDVVEAVKLLIGAHPQAVTVTELVGRYTPLHLLCKGGDSASLSQVLRVLLDADSSVVNKSDREGYLPLHHACEAGCDSDIIHMLLKSSRVTATALTGKYDTALSLACSCNKSVASVKLLVEAFPKALSLRNNYGFAPIHCVCRAHLPRMGIVEILLDAYPSSVFLKTNSGEAPIHLLSSNRGASIGILHFLTRVQNNEQPKREEATDTGSITFADIIISGPTTNRIENTPLHDACFQGSHFGQIETLVLSNPEWVSTLNKAGFTPLQILCKNGRLDEQLVSLFFTVGGAEAFAVIDPNHNTPLHSAIRQDARIDTLRCIIRANPEALLAKTQNGDTPLHLACFRKVGVEIVRELAMATSCGNTSLLLLPNVGGQTPIGIALEEFRNTLRLYDGCFVSREYSPRENRAFEVLATLVKMLYYGPVRCQRLENERLSLLHASLALHRRGVRLDPIFIQTVIRLHPGDAFVADEQGDFACHIEASIPVEKMPILNGEMICRGKFCKKKCHERSGVLSMLLEVNPGATKHRNRQHQFPLGLMINNGRNWNQSNAVAVALRSYPPALHWYKELDDGTLPSVLARIGKDCGSDTIFSLLRSRPGLFDKKN
ncbi:ankyrin repeat domain protein [Nitzschia inconspicua]|uniref:Ankyrin repeat domain protein n=1 Tax=Nitzschia inconspicua TaxID=303405 RepID=A0A9K3KTM7_9STRA|nr:ankyrin repeat domain protein [Nitzschia inconspicua]